MNTLDTMELLRLWQTTITLKGVTQDTRMLLVTTRFTLKEIRYSWCCVAELEGILHTGLDYWNGLLDWPKNHFYGLKQDSFPCRAASCFRSICNGISLHTYRVSSRNIFKGGKIRVLKVKRRRSNCNGISLHRTTHLAKQLMKMMLLLCAATK